MTDHAEGLDEDQMLWPMSKRLVLAPLPAGRGGVGKIIAGVALVGLAIVTGGATIGLFGLIARQHRNLARPSYSCWHNWPFTDLWRRSRPINANAQDAQC